MSVTSTRHSGVRSDGTITGCAGSAPMSCSCVAAAPSHSVSRNMWPVTGADSDERSQWSTRSSAVRCAWESWSRSTSILWASVRRLTGSSANSRWTATASSSLSSPRNRLSTTRTIAWSMSDGTGDGAGEAGAPV